MMLFWLGWFPACMAGPGSEAHPTPCVSDLDWDGDGDVDLADFAELQNDWSGE